MGLDPSELRHETSFELPDINASSVSLDLITPSLSNEIINDPTLTIDAIEEPPKCLPTQNISINVIGDSQLSPMPSTSHCMLTTISEQDATPMLKKTTNAVPSSTAPSSPSLNQQQPDPLYKYFPGKITYKKKPPPEPLMNVVSSKTYRDMVENRQNKNKKNKNADWICSYCDVCFSDDKKRRRYEQWIKCDKCGIQMHVKCIPIMHMASSAYDPNSNQEQEFLCEACT